MKIYVSGINEELKKLDSYITEYEEVYLSMFHELGVAASNWCDTRATVFKNNMYDERIKTSKNFKMLTDKRDIFKYIKDEYSTIGNNIEVELNRKTEINNKINYTIALLQQALREYNDLYDSGLGYYSVQVASRLSRFKNAMTNYITTLEKVQNEFNNYMNKIEEIENNVSKKINNMEYYKITSYTMQKL
ncbi:MAG: hypothetical protein IKO49_04900 [Bacilli bacterium]|nr:hypothetical protein [Bacilli bacterium]